MKNVLLINAECVQTVCMARSLRKNGHYVIGFCDHRISSGYATKWLNEKYVTPGILIKQDDFKSYLYAYLKSNKVDIVIPMADDGAAFLSKNKEYIEKTFNTVCAIETYEKFNMANDKHLLMELCENYGIPHPRTCSLGSVSLNEAARYVGFPAVIKPDISQGAKGITKVCNAMELEKSFPYILKQFGACTLQQYIEPSGFYYNVMLYRSKSGHTVGSTIIKIRRYFPLKGGSSCYCETVEHAQLLNECEKVLNILDWRGFADFDVLEDKYTGKFMIIEINPRVPSSLQASYAAGVDYGKIFIADYFSGSFPVFEYKKSMQVRWMGLDIMWFLFSKDRFSFKPSWFRFFGRNVSYHDGSFSDPLPMFAGMLDGIIKYLNPEFRKAKLKS